MQLVVNYRMQTLFQACFTGLPILSVFVWKIGCLGYFCCNFGYDLKIQIQNNLMEELNQFKISAATSRISNFLNNSDCRSYFKNF
uniref:Uncharacterized protein n=1 Tax=Oryza punctata TaxID=4537 RepID=A0A0E0KW68_ORYPU